MHHLTVLKITSIVMHAALALEVAADLMLSGLNDAISIPAEDITVRIHLDKISLEIALCGLVKVTNSRVAFPLKGWVRLKYSIKCEVTERDLSLGYACRVTGGGL